MGSRKRGKSDPNQTFLIGDDLLIEILSRISTPVVAIRCKLVCKSWCSLISSHYFISRFKQQHIKHPKPLSGMLANTVRRVSMGENPDDDEFNFRGFNLDYLPGRMDVVASCNDLILCREFYTCNYYLCNPFTMQWVALPPPPSQALVTGLVCQPYNLGHGGTIDGPFRYRIVHFHTHMVDMYCSETSEWIQCDDVDIDHLWFGSKIAAYNGKLYCVITGGEYLITDDPFHRTQTSLRLNNGANSHDDKWYSHFCHVGECEGVLRVMRFECRYSGPGHQVRIIFAGISVWELQEEEVILKEHIVFNEDFRRSCLKDIREVAGFHPRNKDVLFLMMTDDTLASINMKTRDLKVEAQFLITYHHPYRYAVPLQLPWWPTTIPSPSPIP